MKENVSIRRAHLGDEAILARIQTESWRAAFAGILDPDTLQSRTEFGRVKAMYLRTLQQQLGRGYILFIGDRPHCIAWWDAARDERLTGKAEIICIHSLPDNWRRGYGSQMMDFLLSDIRGAGYREAVLWVFRDNLPARAFYEAKGFHLTDYSATALGAQEVLYAIQLG